MFDRFYRVEGQRAFGSGLGLAIARELAQAMGGTLEAESEPGRTVFRLKLPVFTGVFRDMQARSSDSGESTVFGLGVATQLSMSRPTRRQPRS